MKISLIKNKFEDVLAAHILDDHFDTQNIGKIISLIREYGIVFWKRTKISIDTYYQWQLQLGYHQHTNIWCSHKKYPIFFRVTNSYIKENQKGLFEDKELDWHGNILFTPDSEEVLGLYAKIVPKGSQTFFANSIPYWKNLNQKKREDCAHLWIEITNKIEQTYEKKLAHHQLSKYQQEDFNKKRLSRDIRNSVNFEKQYSHLYKEPRFLKQGLFKLVPKHPLGMKGIFFPHLNISSIMDSSGKPIANHRDIYENIKQEYILSERYIYYHEWDPGDIVLSDQLTGVHKRNNIWKSDNYAKRELLRSACWYKTNERKHFERSI